MPEILENKRVLANLKSTTEDISVGSENLRDIFSEDGKVYYIKNCQKKLLGKKVQYQELYNKCDHRMALINVSGKYYLVTVISV